MPRRMNWVALLVGKRWQASSTRGELIMRNKLLAIAAIAGAISVPVAAQAQGVVTTGVVRGGGPVVVDQDVDGIAIDQRPAFHQYVIRERVPTYTVPGPVVVGS